MPIIERDVILMGKDISGNQTLDLPVTALKNVEDTAEVKAQPAQGDYIPLMDSADNGQMKKVLLSDLMNAASTFAVGASAPANKKLLWIDTNATTGGLKYHNGSAWVHVPVAYT